jgi:predicted metalloprotease with PDZ domain
MIFQLIAAAAIAATMAASTSCAQRGHDEDPETDVFVVSTKKHSWLGVSVENMTERISRRMNVKTERGALVNSVSDDSPAGKAGIKDDDIIVSFDGTPIEDARDLTRAVGKTDPGKAVECVVMRRDERKAIQVTVEKPPKEWTIATPHAPMAAVGPMHFRHMNGGMMGLSVMDLNRQLAEYFDIPGGRGVLIKEVEKDGPGAKAGLKAGDVIVGMGKVDVDDIDDIRWALDDSERGDTVTVDYVRKGARKKAAVKLDESSGPKGFRFRSGMTPEFDFDFDFDLEVPGEPGPDREQLKLELERSQKEREASARDARREAERAVREVRSAIRSRTI